MDGQYDVEGCYRLLAALVREWMRDARVSERELARLAAFLERDEAWLRWRLQVRA